MTHIHVNMGANKYPNEDREHCWHCNTIPDEIAYTFYGAPLCRTCWNDWWLTTEDGVYDPPFDGIQNSFWINLDAPESEAPDEPAP